jgi:hypothetical protein
MNRGMNSQVPQIESQFFDGRNENYLLSALQNTLQREAGQLNERQVSRLGKMCKYYMNQVWGLGSEWTHANSRTK